MKKFLLTVVAVLFAAVSVNAQFSNGSKSKSSSGGGDMGWRGEVNVGLSMGKIKMKSDKSKNSFLAPAISATYGMKFNDYLFAGAGAGFKYIMKNKLAEGCDFKATMLPIFAEIKAFYPVNDEIAPFVMLDLGYSICLGSKVDIKGGDDGYDPYGWDDDDPWGYKATRKETDAKVSGGLMFRVGAGVVYNRFTLGLGYEIQQLNSDTDGFKDVAHNAFFFSLGYVFKQ